MKTGKTMKTAKIISLVLSVLLILMVLAACDTRTGEVAEQKTLEIGIAGEGTVRVDGDPVEAGNELDLKREQKLI